MDPQQRLLLESGYEATHGAGLTRGGLLGRDVGVFVGLMNTDFASLAGSTSVYEATMLKRRASHTRLRGAGLGSLVQADKTIFAQSSLLCRGLVQVRRATQHDLPFLLKLEEASCNSHQLRASETMLHKYLDRPTPQVRPGLMSYLATV